MQRLTEHLEKCLPGATLVAQQGSTIGLTVTWMLVRTQSGWALSVWKDKRDSCKIYDSATEMAEKIISLPRLTLVTPMRDHEGRPGWNFEDVLAPSQCAATRIERWWIECRDSLGTKPAR